ncbi:FliH/SctL family protein [Paenibacillus humicola]|uniref:FliH/SctL family protein n=1 Tax=Paenibacillus humicola TaxID=3110540 RepID=UPI003B837ED7
MSSRLYKSTHVVSVDDLKKLEWFNKHAFKAKAAAPEEPARPDRETILLRDQILNDAEYIANQRLQETKEQAEAMLSEAKAQIDAWWEERREQDLLHMDQVRRDGYELGYNEGLQQAEAESRSKWESMLAEAKSILDSAYAMKEQIIGEAEPFLAELSTAIAEKIICRQLTIAPEWTLELIRKTLERRREQGVITLCVAPQQLAFIQAARDELSLAIDSQAELQIVPDATVKPFGCVIRSAFGSIDARIDTQLAELKKELVQLAMVTEGREQSDEGR